MENLFQSWCPYYWQLTEVEEPVHHPVVELVRVGLERFHPGRKMVIKQYNLLSNIIYYNLHIKSCTPHTRTGYHMISMQGRYLRSSTKHRVLDTYLVTRIPRRQVMCGDQPHICGDHPHMVWHPPGYLLGVTGYLHTMKIRSTLYITTLCQVWREWGSLVNWEREPWQNQHRESYAAARWRAVQRVLRCAECLWLITTTRWRYWR